MRLVQDGEQIHTEAIATFLIIVGAHVHEYLVHYQSDNSCACYIGPPNYVD
jgi:hypothetical protein